MADVPRALPLAAGLLVRRMDQQRHYPPRRDTDHAADNVERVECLQVVRKPLDGATQTHRQDHVRDLPRKALERRVSGWVVRTPGARVDRQHVDPEGPSASGREATEEVVPARPEKNDSEQDLGGPELRVVGEEDVGEGAREADDPGQRPWPKTEADLPTANAFAPVVARPCRSQTNEPLVLHVGISCSSVGPVEGTRDADGTHTTPPSSR